MNDGLEGWATLGRVGVATLGGGKGQHVFVVADSVEGHWIVLLEHPASNFQFFDSQLSDDNYFSSNCDVILAIREWGIEWLPEGRVEEDVERRVFGIRADIRKVDIRKKSRRARRKS